MFLPFIVGIISFFHRQALNLLFFLAHYLPRISMIQELVARFLWEKLLLFHRPINMVFLLSHLQEQFVLARVWWVIVQPSFRWPTLISFLINPTTCWTIVLSHWPGDSKGLSGCLIPYSYAKAINLSLVNCLQLSLVNYSCRLN